jgi:molybdate transport system substrate-binding protein
MSRGALAAMAALILSGCGANGSGGASLAFLPSSMSFVSGVAEEADGLDAPEFVFAGSARLVAQLNDGADAAVLVTADEETMQRARDQGLVVEDLGIVARNRIVLAVAPGNPGKITSVDDLEDGSLLLGICAPEVPCGRLAREAAETLGLSIRADTEEANVRSLTVKIDTGELHGGLIYATDALAFDLETVDDDTLAAFTTEYPAARVGDGDVGIVDYLHSPAGQASLTDHGFERP